MPNKIPPTKSKAFCPKCKVELQTKIYKKLELDVCPSCQGMWLDTLEFEYITSPKDVYTDPSLEPIFIPTPLEERENSYYECVRCNNLMNRINFKRSGVLIDICCDHGVWLDKGELTRIRRFIASGGLDKTQDKEILNNKMELERLASKVDNIEFLQKVLHRWNLKWIILGGGK